MKEKYKTEKTFVSFFISKVKSVLLYGKTNKISVAIFKSTSKNWCLQKIVNVRWTDVKSKEDLEMKITRLKESSCHYRESSNGMELRSVLKRDKHEGELLNNK